MRDEHHRVSPEGRTLGALAARLAELGRRLVDVAIAGLDVPMVRNEMCASCACRQGTVPNGCAQTQMDLLKSAVEGKPFLCHAPMDGRMCAGWVRVRAQIVAMPLPLEAQAIVARWEYSPPDEPLTQHDERGA